MHFTDLVRGMSATWESRMEVFWEVVVASLVVVAGSKMGVLVGFSN